MDSDDVYMSRGGGDGGSDGCGIGDGGSGGGVIGVWMPLRAMFRGRYAT